MDPIAYEVFSTATTATTEENPYKFFGNKSAFLMALHSDSFVISEYSSRECLEYDLRSGELIRSFPSWDKSSTVKRSSPDILRDRHTRFPDHITLLPKEIWDRTNCDRNPDLNDGNGFAYRYDHEIFGKVLEPCLDQTFGKIREQEEWNWHQRKLARWTFEDKCVFIISDRDGEIISAVATDRYDYADGDSGTRVFLIDHRHLLIWNEGDCPSVMFIKCCDPEYVPGKSMPADIFDRFQAFKQTYRRMYSQIELLIHSINAERLHVFQFGTSYALCDPEENIVVRVSPNLTRGEITFSDESCDDFMVFNIRDEFNQIEKVYRFVDRVIEKSDND